MQNGYLLMISFCVADQKNKDSFDGIFHDKFWG